MCTHVAGSGRGPGARLPNFLAVGPELQPQQTVSADTATSTFRCQFAIPCAAQASESVVGWLRDFATCCLHDPASLSIQLPFASRTAVYEVYVSESQDADFAQLFVLEEGGPPVVASKKYFYHVWAKDERLRHITVRKYLRFSLCEKCVEYIRRRQHIFGDDERKRIRADELSHYKEVREERESYYRRRLLAQREPARYMSVIIDGADQAAYGLPHYRLKNKTLDGALKIPLHLMGCIAHGRDVYGFTYLPNFKAGNNLTRSPASCPGGRNGHQGLVASHSVRAAGQHLQAVQRQVRTRLSGTPGGVGSGGRSAAIVPDGRTHT